MPNTYQDVDRCDLEFEVQDRLAKIGMDKLRRIAEYVLNKEVRALKRPAGFRIFRKAKKSPLIKRPEIKTPITTTDDMCIKLYHLSKQTHVGNAELRFRMNGQDLIVNNVRWNEMGDEIEVCLHKAD